MYKKLNVKQQEQFYKDNIDYLQTKPQKYLDEGDIQKAEDACKILYAKKDDVLKIDMEILKN